MLLTIEAHQFTDTYTLRNKPNNRQPDFKAMGLSDKDLEVMALTFYDGWSQKEIGDLFGIHKQSVKNRVDRVLRIFIENDIPIPKRIVYPNNAKKREPGQCRMTFLDDEIIDLFFQPEDRSEIPKSRGYREHED